MRTVPEGFPPGSDVANLSILGYDPAVYYTGRAPLEAASIGVRLSTEDTAFRCNLVTLSTVDGKTIMEDYSAGHISTEEARRIILDLREGLSGEGVEFYPGTAYRHLMVWRGGPSRLKTTPPHDITGKDVSAYLPEGEGSERLVRIMERAGEILRDHPVNRDRKEKGLKPATSIWLWGEGRPPGLPTFRERFGITGAMISAVDLMKGIGVYAGLEIVNVPGATGYIDTNYRGKAEYALEFLKRGDLVCVHVEAPDEAGHNGNVEDKVRAIESFDREVVGRVIGGLRDIGEYTIVVLTDHPTPITLRTHTSDPVPFVLYHGKGSIGADKGGERGFSERSAGERGDLVEKGYTLLESILGKTLRSL